MFSIPSTVSVSSRRTLSGQSSESSAATVRSACTSHRPALSGATPAAYLATSHSPKADSACTLGRRINSNPSISAASSIASSSAEAASKCAPTALATITSWLIS